MKIIGHFLPIFIVLLSACVPQATAKPTSPHVITDVPLTTETPEPTQTLESTATREPDPILLNQINDIPYNGTRCIQIAETRSSDTDGFEVVFMDSEFGVGTVGDHPSVEFPGLSLWTENTQMAVPFRLPSNSYDPKLSPDHLRIAFQRNGGENQSELWVMDADGQNEKRLASVILDQATQARFPDMFLSLEYRWLPDSNKVVYSMIANRDFDWGIYGKSDLIDVTSGRAIPLAVLPETIRLKFAPDGSQMLAITEGGFRAFSTHDGHMQFTIQDTWNNPVYSPDSKYIIDFIDGGILAVDARDGQQKIIPFEFTIMEGAPAFEGPFIKPVPHFIWADNFTLLMPSLVSDKSFLYRSEETDPNGWTFKIWRVNLMDGTASQSQTFSGDPESVVLSSDGDHLVFFKIEFSDSPESLHLTRLPGTLHLADLNTGQILETFTEGPFEAWSPDFSRYVYSRQSENKTAIGERITEIFLGKIGEEPISLGNVEGSPLWFKWLDNQRLEIIIGSCAIRGYEMIALVSLGPPVKFTTILP